MAALQNAQQALVSALRREDAAAKQVERLQSELAALQDLLAANQRELQRNQMVMKFRNAEVDRRRVCHLVPISTSGNLPFVVGFFAVRVSLPILFYKCLESEAS